MSEFTNGDGQLQERPAKDFMVVAYSTPVGNAAAYYPETNSLVPLDHTAARSNTPVSKAIVIRLERTSMGRVTARRRASHVTADDAVTRPETLVVEEPLEIRVNGKPVTVTMRTPGSDIELAQGFLLTEGVIGHRDDVLTVRYCKGTGPDNVNTYNVLDATLSPRRRDARRWTSPATSTRRRRAGSAARRPSTRSARSAATRPGDDASTVKADTLSAMPEQLRTEQKVFASTGGLHAAALFDADGSLLAVREDIGRHNAVDKVIGWALEQDRIPLTGTVLLVSGRASFELTQKAVMAGIPVLAAVSAPSSLAVDLASQSGLTLVAFLRGESMNVYTRPDRIKR